MPPTVKIEKAEMTGKFSGLFPVDLSVRRLAEEEKMSVIILVKGQTDDGKPLTVEMSQESEAKTQIKPAKAK